MCECVYRCVYMWSRDMWGNVHMHECVGAVYGVFSVLGRRTALNYTRALWSLILLFYFKGSFPELPRLASDLTSSRPWLRLLLTPPHPAQFS